MRHLVPIAAAATLVFIACAQGQDPSLTGDTSGDDVDAGGDGNGGVPPDTSNPYNSGNDGGTKAHPDSGTPPATDSGTSGQTDSGTTAKDSGTTKPPAGDDCTGTTSGQLKYISGKNKGKPETYDDACDGYWESSPVDDPGNPCSPGGNDCDALNGAGGFGAFCCYSPPAGSYCDEDYMSTPQCIPQ